MGTENIIDDNKLGIGIVAGVFIGSVYGSTTDDIAQCVGLGASFGLFLGALWVRVSTTGEEDNTRTVPSKESQQGNEKNNRPT